MLEVKAAETNKSFIHTKQLIPFVEDFYFDRKNIFYLVNEANLKKVKKVLGDGLLEVRHITD